MRSPLVIALAAICVVLTPATFAGAQPSPTLTGEQFFTPLGPAPGEVDCSLDASSETIGFHFQVSGGRAVGPYPGSFFEDGTATTSATTGVMQSLEAQFFVNDVNSNVTVHGKKRFVPGLSAGSGACVTLVSPPPGANIVAATNAVYWATLPDGTSDFGLTTLQVSGMPDGGATMSESFTSLGDVLRALFKGRLPRKLERLLDELRHADVDALCGKLDVLLEHIEGDSRGLTPAQAGALTRAITALKTLLDC